MIDYYMLVVKHKDNALVKEASISKELLNNYTAFRIFGHHIEGRAETLEEYIERNNEYGGDNYRNIGTLPLFETNGPNSLIFKGFI